MTLREIKREVVISEDSSSFTAKQHIYIIRARHQIKAINIYDYAHIKWQNDKMNERRIKWTSEACINPEDWKHSFNCQPDTYNYIFLILNFYFG